jgi:hypothetical protein
MSVSSHRLLPAFLLLPFLLLVASIETASAGETKTRNVVLVTIDGLRWQEVFSGADQRLINREQGGVRDVDGLRQRFWADSSLARREKLMPFLWDVIATDGQLFGDVNAESVARVTNGRYFSYPGYNEILAGFGDNSIDSNAKEPNRNVTVLEWLNQKPEYRGRVAAFASWDVFPFIINARRSGVYVNAGWQELEIFATERTRQLWNQIANGLPHYWDNVRYDIFTFQGAHEYLKVRRPRVLYLAFCETDDWAHAGRYDLYLDAAYRTDQCIRKLWETIQSLDDYRGQTSLIITTDHGRGDVRDGWKSHSATIPGSEFVWIAALGPDSPPLGLRDRVSVTQSQVAASVARLLGEDFAASDDRIAESLPDVVR